VYLVSLEAADFARYRHWMRIPGQGEQDSGLKANSDSGGKANGFRPNPEWRSRWPGMFSTGVAALDIIPAQ
jgi:hypothetical protein